MDGVYKMNEKSYFKMTVGHSFIAGFCSVPKHMSDKLEVMVLKIHTLRSLFCPAAKIYALLILIKCMLFFQIQAL